MLRRSPRNKVGLIGWFGRAIFGLQILQGAEHDFLPLRRRKSSLHVDPSPTGSALLRFRNRRGPVNSPKGRKAKSGWPSGMIA
jgi:hypothetical protein